MNDFISLSQVDREFLIRSTADSIGNIPPNTIEKDYWVVWMIEKLYTLEYADHLYFRGGTSLSKVYRVIDRFSEDIDFGFDRVFFDFDDNEIFTCETVSQQDRLVRNLNKKNKIFLRETILHDLRKILNDILPNGDWNLEFEQDNRQYWLIYNYPQSLLDNTHNEDVYSKPNVKIEIYNNQDNDPWQQEKVKPYISEKFPDDITSVECSTKVVSLGRTFWEKVAIVHSYIERGKFSGDRFSRHLYDLFSIANSEQFDEIISDRTLLAKIIEHREIFYRQPSANYRNILNGQLNLIPKDKLLESTKIDYSKMDEMIYGESPKLADIIQMLGVIQHQVNG